MNLGSLEGAGITSLGSKNLSVGGNNLTTTYSGIIRDGGYSGATGGSLTKVGTGTLTLEGANTYTGDTTVSAGTLKFNLNSGVGDDRSGSHRDRRRGGDARIGRLRFRVGHNRRQSRACRER